MFEQLFSVSKNDEGVYQLNKPSTEMDDEERTVRTDTYQSKRALVKLGPNSPAKEQTIWYYTFGEYEFTYVTAETASEGLRP